MFAALEAFICTVLVIRDLLVSESIEAKETEVISEFDYDYISGW